MLIKPFKDIELFLLQKEMNTQMELEGTSFNGIFKSFYDSIPGVEIVYETETTLLWLGPQAFHCDSAKKRIKYYYDI